MARILVVDDDANNRLLLKTILSSEQHTVFEAASATEGLIQAAERKPELIIADLRMPDVDGVTFVRMLRADPAFASIEIALHTGTPPTDALEDFLEMYRIRTVIPKPCEPEEVLLRVRAALTPDSAAS